MANIGRILSIRGFEGQFEKIERHFRLAENRDVQWVVDVARQRQRDGTWSKDRDMKVRHTVPRSWWFHPAFSALYPQNLSKSSKDGVSLVSDPQEMSYFWEAYRRRYEVFNFDKKVAPSLGAIGG